MPEKYNPKKIEPKWQKRWEEEKLYQAEDFSKKEKKYILVEFPYPSGAGLHVGHVRSYSALDAVSRKLRMQGNNVMYPMGWDAFGLPTENYAIKTGVHPIEATKKNVATFKKQMKSLGLSFDWSREINTTDPKYYKWTQWIFLKLLEKGLAYKEKMPINWCPECKIGLANEEVINGKCERCGTQTEKREKEQWMLAITKYADRLIDDLKTVDYLDKIKTQQINWIGRSEGAEINFKIDQKNNYLLLHGYRGSSKENFFPWLKQKIESAGCEVSTPDLPGGETPKVEEQIEFLQKNYQFNENTVVITHSLGGPLLLKLLELANIKINSAILIAPPLRTEFLDENKRPALDEFCDWKFDLDKIKKQIGKTTIVIDSKDPIVPQDQPEEIAKSLDAKCIKLKKNNHFNQKDLLEIIDEILPKIKVFTTRPDTLFGATYMVVAPEHELIKNQELIIKNKKEVKDYIKKAKSKSDMERTELQKEKTGVELKGVKAINPANGEEIPIFVADYVLSTYGTGVIMAVPAHDERDFEFAKKYNLPIKEVVAPYIETNSKKDYVRHDKETVRRKNVSVIVKHWNEDKFYCLDWERHGWKTFVVGGVEEGETFEQAAIREMKEEAGYQNIKKISKIGGKIFTKFYAEHKDINVDAEFEGYLIELADGERVEPSKEHVKNHKGYWIDEDKVAKYINLNDYQYYWNIYRGGYKEFSGDGISCNSGFITGLKTNEAKKKITKWLKEKGYGKKSVNYKLRDWIFSRQHYWGEPIPVIHCEKCGTVPVPERDLPVKLPEVKKYEPTDTGESPLAAIKTWVNVKCPRCKGEAKRETDTMPNWAGSSWYFLRYIDPDNNKEFADKKKLKYWMPVDLYNGGMEHTTLHLLYSRFWNKFLYDCKLVSTSEPYAKRISHGMVLAEDGRKMSKSFGNVISPDEIVKNNDDGGADTLRMYEMFMGPFSEAIPWNTDGVKGLRRFLEKVWRIFSEKELIDCKGGCKDIPKEIPRLFHKTVKKVTEDIDNFNFNTAISQMMIFINEASKNNQLPRVAMGRFLILLSPFAPHISEELWEKLGHKDSIFKEKWPDYNPDMIKEDTIDLIIQINGKVRDKSRVKAGISRDEALKIAKESEKIKKYLEDKEIRKVIMIKDKLLNLVV